MGRKFDTFEVINLRYDHGYPSRVKSSLVKQGGLEVHFLEYILTILKTTAGEIVGGVLGDTLDPKKRMRLDAF